MSDIWWPHRHRGCAWHGFGRVDGPSAFLSPQLQQRDSVPEDAPFTSRFETERPRKGIQTTGCHEHLVIAVMSAADHFFYQVDGGPCKAAVWIPACGNRVVGKRKGVRGSRDESGRHGALCRFLGARPGRPSTRHALETVTTIA